MNLQRLRAWRLAREYGHKWATFITLDEVLTCSTREIQSILKDRKHFDPVEASYKDGYWNIDVDGTVTITIKSGDERVAIWSLSPSRKSVLTILRPLDEKDSAALSKAASALGVEIEA